MTDRTKQIVELALKAPELLQALREDPKALASRYGMPDQAYALLEAGRNMLGNLLNRETSPIASAQPNVLECPQPNSKPAAIHVSNAVPIVAVGGLTTIAGIVAIAGVVALVAINNDSA